MTARAPRLEWLPPLLVGASAAVAAEVAVSMLLYGGPGMVRSLTTLLAVQGFAFAIGLWSLPGDGPDLIDSVRRRWVLCLVAYLIATLFCAAWSFLPDLGEGRVGQGAGLAILAGLPLYAAGGVLGGISVVASSDPGGRLRGPGAAAATGAALGFVLTGFLLPRAPLPASMLVVCLVMISLSGMIFGAVLGARTEIEVKASRPSRHGEVRVRERRIVIDDIAERELMEGSYLRRSVTLSEQVDVPWDTAVTRWAMPAPDVAWRVLCLGGGASGAPHTVLREHPLGEVDVAERTAAVIELGREYFGTELTLAQGERSAVSVGNLDDLVAMVETTYELVLIDTQALAPVGGLTGLSRATRWRLFDATSPRGIVAVGPLALEAIPDELGKGWVYQSYRRAGRDELVLIARRGDTGDTGEPDWPPVLEGFDAT